MRIFLTLILLIIILYGVLHLSSVQTWLVKKVAKNLSEKLHTKVTVQKVDFRFFNRLILEGVMVEDQKHDTLLYAGKLNADVNDWFFFKKKIKVENIGLENAIVNMNRTDSVWNYQFIVDYFSSPKKNNKNSGNDVDLDLHEAHFTNVYFNKSDGWIGQDMLARLTKFDLVTDLVDLNKKQIRIKSVYLEKPFFSQRDYEGKRPPQPALQETIEKIPIIGAFKWNNSGWIVTAENIEIHDGGFQNDKFTETAPYTDRFDGKHLLFTGINSSMKDLRFDKDTLTMNLLISAKEKSGLDVKKLSADMKLTPELMEFSNLDLITGCSHLRDYYAMRFNDFGEDFSSFLHNVTLEARFKGSVLCSDDLAIFAPALRSWHRTITLEGSAKGPLDNFSAKDMKLQTGNTYLEGDIAMRGLPDIQSTFIDFQSRQLRTNYSDMVNIVPQLRKVTKPAISKLGNIAFKGNFTGFIRDFVAYGTFNTALGTVTADVNMKTPGTTPPAYSGSIATSGFNIGSFINSPDLGTVSANLKISGTGFNLDQLKAKTEGTVQSIGFRGYNYKNLVINGNFEKKLFRGHLSIDDPNLNIPSFDGELNLSEKNLGFRLQANVKRADLKALGFSKTNLLFNGDLNLNFTGNNIDNFLGTARIFNANLLQDTNRLSFDSLTVQSEIIDGKKSLTLNTNDLTANVTGNFRIMELPAAVRVLLNKYYPTYIKAPGKPVSSVQDFTFNIKTLNVDQYVRLIDPKLSGFNNSTISGNFNLQNSRLKLDALVPLFSYDGKSFTNAQIQGAGTGDSLITDIAVDDVMINDSMHLPNSRLRIATSNDVSLIRLNTSASRIFGDAELNASVQTMPDGIKIHFFPSSFIVNNKKWELEKDGELTLRKRILDASEVKFRHEDQEIVLSSELSEDAGDAELVANLKNVDLEDFSFLVPKPKLKGKVTGTVRAKDIMGKPKFEFNGTADSLQVDEAYIGKVEIENADFNTSTGELNYKGFSKDVNKFSFSGNYNLKTKLGNSVLNSEQLDLSILQPYMSSIFSELKGIANGAVQLNINPDDIQLTGDPVITNGSMKIAYTQVKYLFDNQKIHFGKGLIDIGTMNVRDTLGRTGTVSGKIYHNFFHDFSFENLRFSSPRILLLNTTKKDNASFYGNVTGRASMSLNGDIANMKMNIDGEPGIDDTSHIYLPTGTSRESNVIDYIDFIQFGSLMDTDAAIRSAANLTVDMNLTANPACKIDVILDEETGDIIKGTGNGTLNIRVGTKEPLTIRGRYSLTQGEYTFNFQTFLKRPFALVSGGSITWTGDPFLAAIDMEAEYLAKNVDISSLSYIPNARQQTDIRIISHISGNLKKPLVSFEFKLPEGSEYNREFYIVKRLDDFKNDENEMNKQVASLLLFNQFISANQAFLTGSTGVSLATTTIGGVVSSWLTSILSKALEKATKGVISTYIDVNPSLNFQQANELQANVRAGVKVRLSANLQLLVGGNLDYNNPVAQLYSKGVITPDISLEWLLTKDGSLRVTAFNRTTIDFTTGQRNRSGIQLGYQKDIDRLGDIFRSKKRIQYLDSLRYLPKKK